MLMRLAMFLSAACLSAAAAAQRPFDVLIRGGMLADGSTAPLRRADVGIRGERIAAVGDLKGATATLELDATGLVVAPGFLDVHAHVDTEIARAPGCDNFVRMGVTTIVTGNCGGSVPDLAAHLQRVAKGGVGVNYGSLVGAGTVRHQVLGDEPREPTPEELARMRTLVAAAMRAGAFGLSSGLIYVPGTYAKTPELAALASAAAQFGGLYATHMRNENDDVLAAVEEALTIGRMSGAAVQISHVKCSGVPNWGRSAAVLAALAAARAAGQRVNADQYAYDASSTGLDVLFPAEALAIGRKEFAARLTTDAAFRAEMHGKLRALMAKTGFGSFEYARIAHAPGNDDLDGLTIAAASKLRRGADDPDAQAEMAMDLFAAAAGLRVGMIYHTMSEQDVQAFLRQDWIAVAADAGVRSTDQAGKPHPRGAGNNARVLGRYVREFTTLGLELAVHKMTELPASIFGIADRGALRDGMFADVCVFDAKTVADRATYDDPTAAPIGIRWVLVNGTVALDGERLTGARTGQVLRGPGAR